MSTGLIPAASRRTSTWWRAGIRSGTSSNFITSGPPNSLTWMAFIALLLGNGRGMEDCGEGWSQKKSPFLYRKGLRISLRSEVIQGKGFPRLGVGHEFGGLRSQLPRMGYILVGQALLDQEVLLGEDQIRILDAVPVGLEDQGPLEVVAVDVRFSGDAPKRIVVDDGVVA